MPASTRSPLPAVCCLLLPLALTLGQPGPAQAQRGLEARVDRLIDAPPFNRQLWGIAVVDERGRLRYGRNADRLFIPASNTKLVVSAVAAALLPGDWTVRTSLYATGPVIEGVIEGDLVLYGRGDPTWSRRCYGVDTTQAGVCDTDPFEKLRQLADTLRSHGITAIRGGVIGDGSYFEPTLVHPGWETYDLNWWYAAPVSGLGFNDNSVDIRYEPGASVGAPPRLTVWPALPVLTLENRSRTGPAGSGTDFDIFRRPGTMALWTEGNVALDRSPRTEYFALPDPNLYAAWALRSALGEAGISVGGASGSTTDSLRYRQLRLTPALAEVTSRPLRDWIFPILNTSQNWFAEMVLKHLGKQFGQAGSWEEGLAVERRFLIDSVGIDSTQFSLRDGSGLASDNLVSPRAFTQLLAFIRRHPGWETFAAGLPVSGQSGSLRARFVGTPLAGRVAAKTGSISRVNTLSGFIERPDGKRWAFSVQANHHTLGGRAMIAQIDSVVVALGR